MTPACDTPTATPERAARGRLILRLDAARAPSLEAPRVLVARLLLDLLRPAEGGGAPCERLLAALGPGDVDLRARVRDLPPAAQAVAAALLAARLDDGRQTARLQELAREREPADVLAGLGALCVAAGLPLVLHAGAAPAWGDLRLALRAPAPPSGPAPDPAPRVPPTLLAPPYDRPRPPRARRSGVRRAAPALLVGLALAAALATSWLTAGPDAAPAAPRPPRAARAAPAPPAPPPPASPARAAARVLPPAASPPRAAPPPVVTATPTAAPATPRRTRVFRAAAPVPEEEE